MGNNSHLFPGCLLKMMWSPSQSANLASRARTERQDLARHFEQLFFPTPLERQYMYQGNHMHAYVGVTSFFRENISLTMIRIRLNLVSNIILYDSNQTHVTDVEYNQRCELLCYFIPHSITPHFTTYRGISARQYHRNMRRRLRAWVDHSSIGV